jgi:CelD/BcsL family acetyltransferase involved in cellulose biosynthesis
MVTVTIAGEFTELEDLAEDWDRLWRQTPGRHVFGRLDWIRAWWRAYGGDRRLCTPVLHRGDTTVGIWPLCRIDNSIRAIGMPRSDFNEFLCDPEEAPGLLASALEALTSLPRKWSHLEVENVPEPSALLAAARRCPEPWRSRIRLDSGQTCSSVDFDGHDDHVRDRLLENRHLLRKERRIARFGPVAFRHLPHRAEILEHLPRFFEMHAGRRALVGEESMFRGSREREFYRNLVEELDPTGILRFGVLTVGETIVGYHLGFELDGRYVCYKPTFDAEFSKWSPGEVLFHRIFLYVAERGLAACDFTVGDEGFKSRFGNTFGRNRNLTVFGRGLAGATVQGWRSLKSNIKKHPRTLEILRRIRP